MSNSQLHLSRLKRFFQKSYVEGMCWGVAFRTFHVVNIPTKSCFILGKSRTTSRCICMPSKAQTSLGRFISLLKQLYGCFTINLQLLYHKSAVLTTPALTEYKITKTWHQFLHSEATSLISTKTWTVAGGLHTQLRTNAKNKEWSITTKCSGAT